MGQEWIIGVLTDLRSFAHQNDLPLLTAQLEEAALVATVEIASRKDEPGTSRGDGGPRLVRAVQGSDSGQGA